MKLLLKVALTVVIAGSIRGSIYLNCQSLCAVLTVVRPEDRFPSIPTVL